MENGGSDQHPYWQTQSRENKRSEPPGARFERLTDEARDQRQSDQARAPHGTLRMQQWRSKKTREQLQADCENEQQRVTECLDLAVRLRQLWPGDRNREMGASHQDKQKPGAKPGQQAERKRQSHRCRIYR